jgi:hypothetical protein
MREEKNCESNRNSKKLCDSWPLQSLEVIWRGKCMVLVTWFNKHIKFLVTGGMDVVQKIIK